MPAFNFEKRFAAKVSSGEKRQTIRVTRKKGNAKVGDMAHCYTGMRTRKCVRLGSWTVTAVRYITIELRAEGDLCVIDACPIDALDREELAKADGFKDWADMRAWLVTKHCTLFNGRLVMWEYT